MMKHLVTIFIFLLSNICIAQNAAEDFVKINSVYKQQKKMQMKVKYEAYKNASTNEKLQEKLGETMIDGVNKYTRVGEIETIINEQYNLLINHDEKQILLIGKQINNKETYTSSTPVAEQIEELLKMSTNVQFNKESETQNSYLLILPISEYTSVKIIFNHNTYFIEKMVLNYRFAENFGEHDDEDEQPRMEISYYDIDTSPVFTNTVFTYSKYLKKQDGVFQCLPAFKSYNLNVQLLN